MHINEIGPVTYKDIPAIRLESRALSLTVLPAHGGKLASIRHMASGRELLVQAPGERYLPLTYQGSYIDAECSGLDDMFPTIDPILCSALPYSDVQLPDHGEVCRLPWQADTTPESLRLRVEGVCLPYTLEKTIHFLQEDVFQIDYRLISNASCDLPFLWAAHTMIQAEASGEFLLPVAAGAQAELMFAEDGRFGKRGRSFSWPAIPCTDGTVEQLDRTPAYRPDGNAYKYYFTEPLREGWCTYRYPSDRLTLTMRFPADSVPYLGIWVNEGSFKNLYNIAFEQDSGVWRPRRSGCPTGWGR